MKSTYCEYILEKILSTSEVGPILALIAPSPLLNPALNSLVKFKLDAISSAFKFDARFVSEFFR